VQGQGLSRRRIDYRDTLFARERQVDCRVDPTPFFAEGAFDASERFTAELGAPVASQESLGCKHQSSSHLSGGRAAGIGHDGPRQPRASRDRSRCQDPRQRRRHGRLLVAKQISAAGCRRAEAIRRSILVGRGVTNSTSGPWLRGSPRPRPPGRDLRPPHPTDSCFAGHAGVAPTPANSGNTQRHRLHRGVDRQLNRATHIIAFSRARTDPATQAYLARKHAEGKTKAEAIRCLKRHLARRIWRLLYATQTPTPPPPSLPRAPARPASRTPISQITSTAPALMRCTR
jgi:hypothetical protein